MYIDRISESGDLELNSNLICPECKKLLATPIIYEKENRPGLRLFVGAVSKKKVKSI